MGLSPLAPRKGPCERVDPGELNGLDGRRSRTRRRPEHGAQPMLSRRSLRLPITLAVVMLVLLAILAVGWVLLNVFPAIEGGRFAALYWTLLSLGSTFILLLLLGVVLYLILTVKAINLNRRQSNFIDSVTHELKSPIASMKLYLQTLHRHQVSQQEQADFYRSMLEDLDRLDHLIDQLLDAARLESDRTDSEAEDVLLPQLLQDCARTVCLRYRVPAETVRCDIAAMPGPRAAGRFGHRLSQPHRQRGEILRRRAAG